MAKINSVYILSVNKLFVNNKASGAYKKLKVNINNKDKCIILFINKRLVNNGFNIF